MHFLQVVATDDSPYAAFVVEHWSLSVFFPDADGDGWNSNRDCNDSNDLVNPGMTEIIENGVDDDCNEATSDDPVDFDEDGYDVNKEPFDCDDTDPDVNPGQTEILYNEKDDDCDSLISTRRGSGDSAGHCQRFQCKPSGLRGRNIRIAHRFGGTHD